MPNPLPVLSGPPQLQSNRAQEGRSSRESNHAKQNDQHRPDQPLKHCSTPRHVPANKKQDPPDPPPSIKRYLGEETRPDFLGERDQDKCPQGYERMEIYVANWEKTWNELSGRNRSKD